MVGIFWTFFTYWSELSALINLICIEFGQRVLHRLSNSYPNFCNLHISNNNKEQQSDGHEIDNRLKMFFRNREKNRRKNCQKSYLRDNATILALFLSFFFDFDFFKNKFLFWFNWWFEPFKICCQRFMTSKKYFLWNIWGFTSPLGKHFRYEIPEISAWKLSAISYLWSSNFVNMEGNFPISAKFYLHRHFSVNALKQNNTKPSSRIVKKLKASSYYAFI